MPARAASKLHRRRGTCSGRRRRAAARRTGSARLAQRDARVDRPAGQAVDVAQHVTRQNSRSRAEQRARSSMRERRRAAVDRRARGAMSSVSSPWCRHQRLSATPRSGEVSEARPACRSCPRAAGARTSPAPRRRARCMAAAGEHLHLRGGDAAVGLAQLRWRDLCQLQRLGRVDAVLLVGAHDGPDEGHRRGGGRAGGGRCGRMGMAEVCASWHDLQPCVAPCGCGAGLSCAGSR